MLNIHDDCFGDPDKESHVDTSTSKRRKEMLRERNRIHDEKYNVLIQVFFRKGFVKNYRRGKSEGTKEERDPNEPLSMSRKRSFNTTSKCV